MARKKKIDDYREYEIKICVLECKLLKAKKNLLERLRITKQYRELTLQETEIALYLIAENITNQRIGIPPRRKNARKI
jgi:hypothetical protein